MSTGYNVHTSGAGKRSSKLRCQACILPIVLLVLIHMKALHFWNFAKCSFSESTFYVYSSIDQPTTSSTKNQPFKLLPVLSRNEAFGACLMVKGDNDLLSEWIPYHYTLLPLRYLLVATDVGNTEDPRLVLEKWTASNTDLRWWVRNVSEFENLHGVFSREQAESHYYRKKSGAQANGTDDPKMIQYVAHAHLVHKQKAMITYCTKFMKEKGIHWVSMYDTDEFLAINRMGMDNKSEGSDSRVGSVDTRNTTEGTEPFDESYGMRPNLPPIDSNATVVDVINLFAKATQPLKSCHTMPRVSFGAKENFSCPGSEDVKAFARENFDYNSLSTLRFQQHALKEDFSKNRFGKIFIDVSNISDQTLSVTPRNIHRPFGDECIRPVPVFQQSPFYLMHYAGGWERFKSKNDTRRGFEQWKELADVSDSTSCCQEEVYRWLPQFVAQVGPSRAKFLLGGNDNSAVM